ncbi:MAG TPA: ABC transporter permease [Anaerolineae bacterium]|nr:ABC transporter permease [Anaerolineae bacterium]
MRETLLIFSHEYWKHIWQRSFFFIVFGIPVIFVILIVGVVLFLALPGGDPVGLVDQANIITLSPPDDIELFPDEPSARDALRDRQLQAYYLLPPDYLQTGQIERYAIEQPLDTVDFAFNSFLRDNLLAQIPDQYAAPFSPQTALYTTHPLSFTTTTNDEPDSVGQPPTLNNFFDDHKSNPASLSYPYFFAFTVFLSISTMSSYLLQSVVAEKENRTMEIMITTISPEKLLTGKISALVAVGFTQIFIWIAPFLGLVALIRRLSPDFAYIQIPWPMLLITLLWFIPFYMIVAALTAGIGTLVPNTGEAQSAMGVMNLFVIMPVWLSIFAVANPDSDFAVTLSLFPFSAGLTLLVRYPLTDIPFWQFAASFAIQIILLGLVLILVTRLLRLGLLRFGRKVPWRETIRYLIRGTT